MGNPILDALKTSDFTSYFSADFALADIAEGSISRAFLEAKININPGIFTSDDALTIGFFYLVAHYLTLNIRAAASGIMGVGQQIVTSASVAGISESYGIPEDYLKNPYLNAFAKTEYGLRYLQMIIPNLVGVIGCVDGATTP